MAKLTRTQKYADLRTELANDKETANATQDLNSYADRFNNVQETLAPEAPRRPATEPEYTYKPNNGGSSYFDSFMNAPSQQPSRENFDPYFNNDKPADLNFDDFYKGVFNDVNDATDNTISRNERDTYLNQTINDVNFHNMANGQATLNQIVNNAVNEVRHTEPVRPAYNEPNVVDNTYDFNRAPVQNTILDADAINNDDDFNNTVSMEITKIMNQMETPTVAARPVAPTPVRQTTVAPEPVYVAPKVEEPVYVAQEVKFETPVVNTVIEEKPQEVVEIKNINETKEEPLRNTVSGTIPFVVSENEDADIDDDADTDGSNVVLNVILIVLIIVLMAVLGLIIFYILKTKGIL